MNLTLQEMKIMEQLLDNRLNASYDPEIEELSHKFKREINNRLHRFNQVAQLGRLEHEIKERYGVR